MIRLSRSKHSPALSLGLLRWQTTNIDHINVADNEFFGVSILRNKWIDAQRLNSQIGAFKDLGQFGLSIASLAKLINARLKDT
jgi:hypothetical protein